MFKHMNKVELTLGVDIGGSHISAALARADDGQWLPDSYSTKWIDPTAEGGRIIDDWMEVIHRAMAFVNGDVLTGIGVAMPGPFDYENGISLIEGVNKYDKLFGINIKQAFLDRLEGIAICFEKDAIHFENDAACFGLGECLTGKAAGYKKVIAITLGTGFGAAFVDGGRLVKSGALGVPRQWLLIAQYSISGGDCGRLYFIALVAIGVRRAVGYCGKGRQGNCGPGLVGGGSCGQRVCCGARDLQAFRRAALGTFLSDLDKGFWSRLPGDRRQHSAVRVFIHAGDDGGVFGRRGSRCG